MTPQDREKALERIRANANSPRSYIRSGLVLAHLSGGSMGEWQMGRGIEMLQQEGLSHEQIQAVIAGEAEKAWPEA